LKFFIAIKIRINNESISFFFALFLHVKISDNMGRKKSLKLSEVDNLPNVFPHKFGRVEEKIEAYFGNGKPLVLEIGCGNADYSRALALANGKRNYIGIDIRGARIWNASQKVLSEKLNNTAFVIARAEFINEIFPSFKFEEIWIPFPDPFPKKRSASRRLISPGFIERYRKIASPGATINLKTDDTGLYEYGLEVLSAESVKIIKRSADLYSESNLKFEEKIKTKYELQHLAEGKKIKLISFTFTV